MYTYINIHMCIYIYVYIESVNPSAALFSLSFN